MMAPFFWTVLLTAWLTSTAVVKAADCPCGYLDSAQRLLWTDAIITYFNESDASDAVVARPTTSPAMSGEGTAGDTGTGQQAWAVIGNQLNLWEEAFGATFRSGARFNNTQLDTNLSALSMAVNPAISQDRIVYGAQFVTRRRDILYGSFRAAMAAELGNGAGTAFEMTARYNESETVNTGLYMDNLEENASLRWSFSSRFNDANPVRNNITSLQGQSDGTVEGFLEHRMDWTPDYMLWSNNNTNASVQPRTVQRTDEINVPSTPVPFSFHHWSNGDPIGSHGPPRRRNHYAYVSYVRIFFNSSRTERQEEFEQQCSSSSTATVCDTEDMTLRGSTTFDLAALAHMDPAKRKHKAPLYSIIVMAITGGFIVIFVAHGLVKRLVDRLDNSRKRESQLSAVPTVDAEVGDDSNQIGRTGPVLDGSSNPHRPASQSTTSSHTVAIDQGDSHVQGSSLSPAAPILTHSPLWNSAVPPAATNSARWDIRDIVQQAMLEEDSDTEWEDDWDKDHDFMVDTAQEISLAKLNDDGLGRPDLDQRQGELHVLPFSEAPSVPSFSGLKGYRRPTRAFHGSYVESLGSPYGVSSPISALSRTSSAGWYFEDDRKDSHAPTPSTPSMTTFPVAGQVSPSEQLEGSFVGQYANLRSVSVWERSEDEQQPLERKETLARRVSKKPKDRDDAKKADKKQSIVRRFMGFLMVPEGAQKLTASGAARVDYLEGLRGMACFLVSFHHFMLIWWYAATTPGGPVHYQHFEPWFHDVFAGVMMNNGLKLGIFFVLPARVMCTRYMLRGRIVDLADGTFRRVPRLAVPIFGAVLVNYFMQQADAYKWVPRLASRTWSTWSYFSRYSNMGQFLDGWFALWFTLPPMPPLYLTTYATGVLWTIPTITQNSFSVLITVLVSREMPDPRKRYCFYAICMLFTWYTNNLLIFFLGGLVIADMDNKLKYRQLAARGFPALPSFLRKGLPKKISTWRVPGQIFAWILFLGGLLCQYLESLGLPGGRIAVWEHGIQPDLATSRPRVWDERVSLTYYDLRGTIFVLVMGLFMLCDLNKKFCAFFLLRFWNFIGRNAFALFLLHGPIFWSWGAFICLQLLSVGAPYWAAVTVTFLTSYFVLGIACEVFTATIDKAGVMISKAMWRYYSAALGRKE